MRVGKRQIAGFWSREVARQLKMLGAKTERTIQSLLTEALLDLFKKRGKRPIAQ